MRRNINNTKRIPGFKDYTLDMYGQVYRFVTGDVKRMPVINGKVKLKNDRGFEQYISIFKTMKEMGFRVRLGSYILPTHNMKIYQIAVNQTHMISRSGVVLDRNVDGTYSERYCFERGEVNMYKLTINDITRMYDEKELVGMALRLDGEYDSRIQLEEFKDYEMDSDGRLYEIRYPDKVVSRKEFMSGISKR